MQKRWFIGDAIPDFTVRSSSGQKLQFQNVAGRYIALCFFGSAAIEKNRNALQYALSRQDFFNDVRASFFGVSIDSSDEATGRVRQITPGFRFLWDDDKRISRMFGAITSEAGEKVTYSPFTLLLDYNLRVLANIPIFNAAQHNDALAQVIANLPEERNAVAPVLLVERIFEHEFCAQVIKNNTQKELYELIQKRIERRLLPEIAKIFNFDVAIIEKYAINLSKEGNSMARYNRHNVTPATAHRKFFAAINWSDGFNGGEHRFPEYSDQLYAPAVGGALVASCSMIHEILPITYGSKHSAIMFFYNEKNNTK